MLSLRFRFALAVGLLSLVASSAHAQFSSAGRAPTYPLTYRSALTDYKPFDEQPVAPWRKTNDTVGQIGGWRTHAREAQQPPAAKDDVAPASPAPGPRQVSPDSVPMVSPGAKP